MSEDTEGDKKIDELADYLGGLWVACLVIPLVLIVVIVVAANMESVDASGWGVYGDFVGGLSNPLISALTFLALLLTIIQNQKVLRVNEQELEETRKEIALTREANEKQAEEFKAQNEQMKKDSEVETISQALIRLSDLMNEQWEKKLFFQSNDSVMTITKQHAQVFYSAVESGFGMNMQAKLQAIEDFLPLATAYAELLIELRINHQGNPTLRAMTVIQGKRLAQLKAYHYFDDVLNEEQMEHMSSILHGWEHEQVEELY